MASRSSAFGLGGWLPGTGYTCSGHLCPMVLMPNQASSVHFSSPQYLECSSARNEPLFGVTKECLLCAWMVASVRCNFCYLLLAELYACHSALGFAKVS